MVRITTRITMVRTTVTRLYGEVTINVFQLNHKNLV